MRTLTAAFCISILYVTSSLIGNVRMTNEMNFRQLASKSDVIIIADADPPRATENTEEFLPNYVEQLETRLNVHAILKGTLEHKEHVDVVHFRLRAGKLIVNGPMLLEFRYERKRPPQPILTARLGWRISSRNLQARSGTCPDQQTRKRPVFGGNAWIVTRAAA